VIEPIATRLRDGRQWLRVTDEDWADPLDLSYAEGSGGRWNPPRSFPVLYLNADVATARAQIHQKLEGQPVDPEDLDAPYVLIAVALPSRQRVADAVSEEGLVALDLPPTYPMGDDGQPIPRAACQPTGSAVERTGLRGLTARSAATRDGFGRELAWFPARPSSRARRVGESIPFALWWNAAG
jgi:hypothetical protein